MIGTILLVAALGVPAARIDGSVVAVEEVDAATGGRAERLRADLARLAAQAAGRLLDARLGVELETEPEVSDGEVEARRPEVDALVDARTTEAAIRWEIARDRREEELGRRRDAARKAARARIDLPPPSQLEEPLPPDLPIAWIGERPIGASELERRVAVGLYRLRGELYRERRRRLEEIVDARLLAAEAARRGTTVAGLLPAPIVPDAEVERYVEERRTADRALDPARVRPLLEARARADQRARLLERLRSTALVEVLLRPPAPPVVQAVDDSAPMLGPRQASVERTIVVFADYRTRASRRVHLALDEVRRTAPDVRVVTRDFVPHFDPVAEEAARLVRCADRTGRLASVRSWLLQREPPPLGASWLDDSEGPRSLEGEGAREQMEACLADPVIERAVREDTESALALGFTEPPALLIGGTPLGGVQSAKTMLEVLEGGAPSLDN